MHEHALMADLMHAVLKAAELENARAVLGISVRLGALSHMTPAHFAEHFEDAAAGTIAVLAAAFTLILGTTETQARGRWTRGYSSRGYSGRVYSNRGYGNRGYSTRGYRNYGGYGYGGYGYRGYGYRGYGYRGGYGNYGYGPRVGVSVGNYGYGPRGYGGVGVSVGGFF